MSKKEATLVDRTIELEKRIEDFNKTHEKPLELRRIELEKKAAELNKLLTTIAMPK